VKIDTLLSPLICRVGRGFVRPTIFCFRQGGPHKASTHPTVGIKVSFLSTQSIAPNARSLGTSGWADAVFSLNPKKADLEGAVVAYSKPIELNPLNYDATLHQLFASDSALKGTAC
jgi:hypothetical protein